MLRDMRTVYLALGIPLVMLILFGYALTLDVESVDLIVVDQDRSVESRALIERFHASGAFQITARRDDTASLERDFFAKRARAALVVPRGYGKALARGEEVAVQVIADGTNANDASIALGFASAIGQNATVDVLGDKLADLGIASAKTPRSPVEVKVRNWFNPTLEFQWYLVPGLIAVILSIIATILMALTVSREWERGTMEQLLVTPVRRSEIVLGKVIPYFVIGIGQLVIVSGAGVILFDVPLEGNVGMLLGASCLFLLTCLAQGLLISVITRNQQVSMQLAILTSMLPSILLSGFMSPIASMPKLVQDITHIVPARYFLVVTRGIFLKGVDFGAIAFEIGALCAFALVLIVASVRRFKTRLD